ncbi:MAG TPA: DUF3054 domain-containing protein [Ktedonobacterales bacterium]|jgi:Protein of unknown function (DUF3054)|nr:DUF3054 domain-containing protein [Ktedonobacterales bacterium]
MQTDDPTAPTASPGGMRSGYGRIAALVVGDLIAFVVFATLGRDTHHEATGLGAIGETLWTALPFMLGWFLVAPWLGAFRRAGTERPLDMLQRTEIAWLASWPVALLLRWALTPDHHLPPLAFAIVALLANAVILGGWRTAFAALTNRGK